MTKDEFAMDAGALSEERDPRDEYEYLSREETYEGALRDLDVEQAKALMIELLAYFCHPEGLRLPFPPKRLPGVGQSALNLDSMYMLQMGFDYFVALLHGRPRRQLNLLNEVTSERNRMYWLGKEDEKARTRQSMVAEIERRNAEYQAEKQANPPAIPKVYFIASESGAIKIGMAIDPVRRLKALQTSHHERLSIVATREGGRPVEREYHRRFKAHRLHGEWFARVPEIEAEITRLSGGVDQ